ncbi:Aspartyl/glutamyl-tRNA(Asn/Gln) amidotransferase subunit B [Azospirillaceae bacterium]
MSEEISVCRKRRRVRKRRQFAAKTNCRKNEQDSILGFLLYSVRPMLFFSKPPRYDPRDGPFTVNVNQRERITMLIQGETGDWEIVIGLEVHAQVISKAKLFSGAATDFGAEPNSQVSFIDAAFPGMLPVINQYCVEQSVRAGLGLKAKINAFSVFDRKNYFYADLPAGYQISQYKQPIVGQGRIALDMPDGSSRVVGVTRLHMEQDAGKSLHDQHPSKTYVDLNRSGVALMEIVSEPDMRSPEEAGAYLRKLRAILRYLDVCDGNMEEGSMRADVNVSVRRPNGPLGTRCEIKNVNSIRYVQQAIEYEARRQVDVLEAGGTIKQETRLWDTTKGVTRSMRSKEEAHDYRYFPDPDLLPLELDPAWIESIRRTLPELPDDKKARLMTDYRLSAYDAGVLVAEKARADFYEAVAKGRDSKITANWVTGELFGALNKAGKDIGQTPVSAEALGGLIDLIADNTISGRIAKDVFEEMFATGQTASAIVEAKGLRQVTDTGALETAVQSVLDGNAAKVAEYRNGKEKLFGFFVGQVMKQTQGKANPAMVNEILTQKLKG